MKKNNRLFLFAVLLMLVFISRPAYAQWQLTGNSNALVNSKLGTTNAVPFNLTTNNLTRLRIASNGSVGIGTASPVKLLHVNGVGAFGNRVTSSNSTRALNLADTNAVLRILRVHNSFAPAVELISRTSANGANIAYWDMYAEPKDASFRIRDRQSGSNLDRLTISHTTGNVGIGTTKPRQLLHVEGSSAGSIFVSTSQLGTSSGSGVIGYTKYLPTGAGQQLGYFLVGSRGGAEQDFRAAGMVGYAADAWTGISHPTYLTFETTPIGSTTRQERMRIDEYGFVNVSASLDVRANYQEQDQNDDLVAIYGTSVNENIDHGIGVYGTGGAIGIFGEGYDGGGTGVSGSGVTGVSGSGSGFAGVYGNGPIGVYGRSGFSDIGLAAGVYGEGNNDSWGVQAYSSGSYGLYAETGEPTSYAGYFNGDVFSTGTYLGSDRKLKQNITYVENALAIVNRLQPKIYEYRHDGNFKFMHLPKGKHYGLVAQDVEEVLPDLVKNSEFKTGTAQPIKFAGSDSTNSITVGGKRVAIAARPSGIERQKGETVDFKAVNYTELIPILIKAVQELNKKTDEIEELKKEVAELKALMISRNSSTNTANLSSVYLEQNTPNPTNGFTLIHYYLSQNSGTAKLVVTDAKGLTVSTIALSNKSGHGQVELNASALGAGTYVYTLYVNEKVADSKKMVITL